MNIKKVFCALGYHAWKLNQATIFNTTRECMDCKRKEWYHPSWKGAGKWEQINAD